MASHSSINCGARVRRSGPESYIRCTCVSMRPGMSVFPDPSTVRMPPGTGVAVSRRKIHRHVRHVTRYGAEDFLHPPLLVFLRRPIIDFATLKLRLLLTALSNV